MRCVDICKMQIKLHRDLKTLNLVTVISFYLYIWNRISILPILQKNIYLQHYKNKQKHFTLFLLLFSVHASDYFFIIHIHQFAFGKFPIQICDLTTTLTKAHSLGDSEHELVFFFRKKVVLNMIISKKLGWLFISGWGCDLV